jgi:hypothetical protein
MFKETVNDALSELLNVVRDIVALTRKIDGVIHERYASRASSKEYFCINFFTEILSVEIASSC